MVAQVRHHHTPGQGLKFNIFQTCIFSPKTTEILKYFIIFYLFFSQRFFDE